MRKQITGFKVKIYYKPAYCNLLQGRKMQGTWPLDVLLLLKVTENKADELPVND